MLLFVINSTPSQLLSLLSCCCRFCHLLCAVQLYLYSNFTVGKTPCLFLFPMMQFASLVDGIIRLVRFECSVSFVQGISQFPTTQLMPHAIATFVCHHGRFCIHKKDNSVTVSIGMYICCVFGMVLIRVIPNLT